MISRRARCGCGQLTLMLSGEPTRVSICHCFACQRRTGSAFGVQARFSRDQVQAIAGETSTFVRRGDSGAEITMHFCPGCGSTVYWELPSSPEHVVVAAGAFADPTFPAPTFTVYEARRHDWAEMPGLDAERFD